MRLLYSRVARLALCVALTAICALSIFSAPGVFAQDEPPQGGQGQGRGRGMGGGMGMFGSGAPTAGTVTAIAGSKLTIKNEQGQVYTVETGPNTRVRKDRELAKFSDIKVGDTVMAAGNVDDQAKTVGAMFVVVLNPEQVAQMEKMRASFGKTWTAGRVTAIKDLTLTVERPDKVTQAVAVDENTVFHKRERGQQQDITFPEIKVGDLVRAEGAVQGSNFLATTLDVSEPRQPGERRYRQGGPAGEGQPPQGAPPSATPNVPQN
jgi:hypothetical protein